MIVFIKNCKIELDSEDWDRLKDYTWHIAKKTCGSYAVTRIPGRKKRIYMHQLVLGVSGPNLQIDHIDRNTFNNRRTNLRTATVSQNQANRGPTRMNTSGFKGVYKNGRGWCASIGFEKSYYHLGTYKKPEEAARAYDQRARELFGEFAYLNFPEEI